MSDKLNIQGKSGVPEKVPRVFLTRGFMRLAKGVQNYPLTLIASFTVFCLLVYITGNHIDEGPDKSVAVRMTFSISLGGISGISLMWIGRKWIKEEIKALIFTGVIMIGIMIGAQFYLGVHWGYVAKNIYTGLMLFFVVLFLMFPVNSKDFGARDQLIRSMGAFFQAALFAAVFYAGASATLATLRYLFQLYFIEWEYFSYIFYAAVFVLGATVFLSELNTTEVEISKEHFGRVIQGLLLWIVLPIFIIYTGILYAYFVQILLQRTWPRGMVSHMVLWYSALSVVLLILIQPIGQDKKFVRKFCKGFPWTVFPVLGMMFVSMGMRIHQYGVTESRYFVVALGIWVLFSMLWFGYWQGKKNAGIFIALGAVIIISLFGPWSSFSVSKYSQNQALNQLLDKNGMLKDNVMVPGKISLREDKIRIENILRYFQQYHDLKEIQALPPSFEMKNSALFFGFEPEVNSPDNPGGEVKYVSISTDFSKGLAVDIKGYGVAIQKTTSEKQKVGYKEYETWIENKKTLYIKKGEKEISIDLLNLTRDIAEKQSRTKQNPSQEELILYGEEKGIEWKIAITEMAETFSYDQWRIETLQFILFLK